MKKNYKYIFLLGFSALSFSCGTSTDSDGISMADTSTVSIQETTEKTQNIFNSIPSPVETSQLLEASGARYDAMYLNPIENVSKYATVASKALNLGIYGFDLSFTSVFDQTQESMLYLQCANKLATGLGISGSFDENTSSRLEANQDNKDSLLAIISESYWGADKYLKENGQPGVSTIFIAGGWLEGLYLATRIANETQNEEVATLIGKQKQSFDNLYTLLESQSSQNHDVENILNQLKELKKSFDGIEINSSKGVVEKNITPHITQEQLAMITNQSAEIRNRFIQ